MQAKLPYLASPGAIPKVLSKVEEARRPERFTQDFLETKLGLSGGGFRATIPLLKRMGFLAGDGSPTSLYDQYRNPTTQRTALAEGVRNAYREVFDRNQYASELTRDKLSALVFEMTGLEKDSSVGRQIVATFWTLKEGADFESTPSGVKDEADAAMTPTPAPIHRGDEARHQRPEPRELGLSLAYTINLNLPESTNPEVFSAIFKALRENLLQSSS